MAGIKKCLALLHNADVESAKKHPPTPSILSNSDMENAMRDIMSGAASPAQMGAFLMSLPLHKVNAELLAVAATVMRSHALPCVLPPSYRTDVPVMDIVGTGGDSLGTFNASTAAAVVVAAAGGRVMKHGNRSSSSQCGSADLLETLGARLDIDGPKAVKVLEKSNFCYLFAPQFHISMRHVAPIRPQLGVKTIFNILGPLTNPCQPLYQLTGVFDKALGPIFAEAFLKLGMKRAMVVHSAEGMDEISPCGVTHAWILDKGTITQRDLVPTDFGIDPRRFEEVKGGNPLENKILFENVLTRASPQSDFVLINAAAALWVLGLVSNFKEGVERARATIQSGQAKKTLQTYIRATQEVFLDDVKTSPKQEESILNKIAVHRQALIDKEKSKISLNDLFLQALHLPVPLPLDVLKRINQAAKRGLIALMAEIKRASPSKGQLAPAGLDVVSQAVEYAQSGASVISVLTEPHWFKGSIEDLRAIRSAVDKLPNRPAILLKDFVQDEYQLVQARIAGADTALLIVAILSQDRLTQLIKYSRSLGMEPLVEVATESELKIALSVGSRFIGVNNRDLHTFNMEMGKTVRLADFIPQQQRAEITLAALSGIKDRSDVEVFEKCGCQAVLVGETLMKSSNVPKEIRELLGIKTTHSSVLAKICGVRDVKSALLAKDHGANLIGLIFAKSKRQVSVVEAKEIVKAIKEAPLKHHSLPSLPQDGNWLQKSRVRLEHQLRQASRPLVVGVFMDQSIDFINKISSEVDLDIIQLHGSEGWDIVKKLNRPVIRQLPVTTTTTTQQILQLLDQPTHIQERVLGVLLDTKTDSSGGGSGETFDWKIAQTLSRQGIPFFIAGGLHPENVSEAIATVCPWGVDVSSGIETAGIKDSNKIKLFLQKVSQANHISSKL